jgi:hypothetical protein
MELIEHRSGGEAMAWEYYGDELIIIGVLTTILLIAVLNFLKSRFKRRLVFSLTLLLVGYVSCIIGLVFVRGWDALGWILIGISLYVIGLLTYISVVIYHWVKGRRTTNS